MSGFTVYQGPSVFGLCLCIMYMLPYVTESSVQLYCVCHRPRTWVCFTHTTWGYTR